MFRTFLALVLDIIISLVGAVAVTLIYNWHIGDLITALPTISVMNSFCFLLLLSAIKTKLTDYTKSEIDDTDEDDMVIVTTAKILNYSLLIFIGWILHLIT